MSHNPSSAVVLFVCTGNVCRSPMAAALFNRRAERAGEQSTIHARSAGTWALEHQTASGYAKTVMARRHLDLSAHRAHTISPEELDQVDLIIVMTTNHRDALAAEFPQHRCKLHLMSELQDRNFDIGDPYGGALVDYEHCAQELENLIEQGYDRVKAWILSDDHSALC